MTSQLKSRLEVNVTNISLANYIWAHQTFLEIKSPLPQAHAPPLDFDITTIRQKHVTNEEYLNTYLPPKQTVQQTNSLGKLCPICLELFDKKAELVRKLRCGHVFHIKCIDRWMSKNKDYLPCPYCRKVQYD